MKEKPQTIPSLYTGEEEAHVVLSVRGSHGDVSKTPQSLFRFVSK